jgi:hypothetical protein
MSPVGIQIPASHFLPRYVRNSEVSICYAISRNVNKPKMISEIRHNWVKKICSVALSTINTFISKVEFS